MVQGSEMAGGGNKIFVTLNYFIINAKLILQNARLGQAFAARGETMCRIMSPQNLGGASKNK